MLGQAQREAEARLAEEEAREVQEGLATREGVRAAEAADDADRELEEGRVAAVPVMNIDFRRKGLNIGTNNERLQ